jgi:hypothetical protein
MNNLSPSQLISCIPSDYCASDPIHKKSPLEEEFKRSSPSDQNTNQITSLENSVTPPFNDNIDIIESTNLFIDLCIEPEKDYARIKTLIPQMRINENSADVLHFAILVADKTIVKDLIEAGADVNRQEPERLSTALHLCVDKKNLDLTQILLSHPKIDISIKNKNGFSPIELCEYLLENDQQNTHILNIYNLFLIHIKKTPIPIPFASIQGFESSQQSEADDVNTPSTPITNPSNSAPTTPLKVKSIHLESPIDLSSNSASSYSNSPNIIFSKNSPFKRRVPSNQLNNDNLVAKNRAPIDWDLKPINRIVHPTDMTDMKE